MVKPVDVHDRHLHLIFFCRPRTRSAFVTKKQDALEIEECFFLPEGTRPDLNTI